MPSQASTMLIQRKSGKFIILRQQVTASLQSAGAFSAVEVEMMSKIVLMFKFRPSDQHDNRPFGCVIRPARK